MQNKVFFNSNLIKFVMLVYDNDKVMYDLYVD